LIATLEDNKGNIIQKHEEKSVALWEAYKKRSGTTKYSHMYFDLQELLTTPENLRWLDEPFSKEEIDTTI
jgi:hypothetical protein